MTIFLETLYYPNASHVIKKEHKANIIHWKSKIFIE